MPVHRHRDEGDPVARWQRRGAEAFENLVVDPRAGLALHGDRPVSIAAVGEIDPILQVLLHPRGVLRHLGGIDDEEIIFFADTVDDEVVDDACPLVEHEGVLSLSDFQRGDPVGEDAVQPGAGFLGR